MSPFRSLPIAFWFSGGLLSLSLGVIGLFLPLLPTTPFILLAAYCFSKGSPRCHAWLLSHKVFGPMIVDWEMNRIIRRRVKVLSTIMTVTMISYPVFFLSIPDFLKLVMIAGSATAIAIVWFQKER